MNATSSATFYIGQVESPIGQILVVTQGDVLCSVDFEGYEDRMMALLKKRYGALDLKKGGKMGGICDRIRAYLSGDLHSLDDIPTETSGTEFQQQVWHALRSIPPGSVITYGELAQQIGRPKAVRAVGMTNGLNPIAIVLPCHRVVGANGKLTGYAGGLARKRWLLAHEGVDLGVEDAENDAEAEEQLSMFG
ncbi:MAG: methylated-DNA--[protein]-cysteine S-methyltransferase [Cyanobacteria bacterium P01_D01_bin.44]